MEILYSSCANLHWKEWTFKKIWFSLLYLYSLRYLLKIKAAQRGMAAPMAFRSLLVASVVCVLKKKLTLGCQCACQLVFWSPMTDDTLLVCVPGADASCAAYSAAIHPLPCGLLRFPAATEQSGSFRRDDSKSKTVPAALPSIDTINRNFFSRYSARNNNQTFDSTHTKDAVADFRFTTFESQNTIQQIK